jgi:hypothetical protein
MPELDPKSSQDCARQPLPIAPGTSRAEYIEQYKAYLADLGNIGTRYATVQGFYVTAISALLGLLALTESSSESSKLLSKLPTSTLFIVCLFSAVLCVVWTLTISFYRRLFGAKISVLRRIERYLPFDCFTIEYDELRKTDKRGNDRLPSLLRIERYVPLVLVLFFLALFLFRALSR